MYQVSILHDSEINEKLAAEGWTVLRFFGNEIKKNLEGCVQKISETVALKKLEAQKCRRSK